MKKDIIITALLTFCLTATLFMIATSRSQVYNPWSDLNGDGKIDIFDVVGVTGAYATTGDPTKNVSVISMPPTTDVNVWWQESFTTSDLHRSAFYHASGFGQLHVLIYASGLGAGETLSLDIQGNIFAPDHSSVSVVDAYTVTLTQTSHARDITIPVPSGQFNFQASTDASSSCVVSLSFYLTYA